MSDPCPCPMPGCAGEMATSEWGDLACPTCGCAGPEGVIDAIAFNHRKLDAALLTLGCVEETMGALARHLGYTGKAGDIEALAAHIEAMRSPAGVLAEAERLLREAGAVGAAICDAAAGKPASVCLSHGLDEGGRAMHGTWAPSLAEAYAKLTGGRDD